MSTFAAISGGDALVVRRSERVAEDPFRSRLACLVKFLFVSFFPLRVPVIICGLSELRPWFTFPEGFIISRKSIILEKLAEWRWLRLPNAIIGLDFADPNQPRSKRARSLAPAGEEGEEEDGEGEEGEGEWIGSGMDVAIPDLVNSRFDSNHGRMVLQQRHYVKQNDATVCTRSTRPHLAMDRTSPSLSLSLSLSYSLSLFN